MLKYTNKPAICSIFAPMVRIGRQIPHFNEVDPGSVRAEFSEDRRFRYLLEMRFRPSLYNRERSRRAAVILKNPSAADVRAADTTIRKVETYVYHHLVDVLELSILNLFALRATDAADLNREFLKYGEELVVGPSNDQVIRSCCEKADYVLVAWGSRSGIDAGLYGERIHRVSGLLAGLEGSKIFRVRGKQVTMQPLHGMMWAYDHEMVPYAIDRGERA
jgi:hypothetical protein